MKTLDSIVHFIDINFIYCLPFIILTLLTIQLIFKDRFETSKALNVVRWFIITYAVVSIFHMLTGIIVHGDGFSLPTRASDAFKFSYWTMFICAVILPFSLLLERLARSTVYLLLIAILLKVGRYFEIFVISVTSAHRDHSPHGNTDFYTNLLSGVLVIVFQGIALAIILLVIVQLTSKNETPVAHG